jgi:N-acetylglucosaminyldiphosphoundecaprenol N-acetyl-beta-D-mannosaminyltransferase
VLILKKITILSLHLGYGGIEVAISNLANMLTDKYDVEIINVYGKNPPVYQIDKRVKINNLINDISNKEELLSNLRKFRIFKTIKELIRAIKILYLKNKRMKEAIINCNSDIIISTRVEFTEIINKYYKGNAVTISQEHNHHNNNQKYINRIINSLENIDYFMPVSKKLTKFYKNKVKGKTKVIYGQLCLDYIPEKESKKNTKDIISIGRLSEEKGYLDLIDVFKMINEEDNECILHIIGDGVEREKIENKIKELNLEDKVNIYGFKEKDFIHEKLYDMSLYLMTSYFESFGLVLLEASSYGIPCIAFDSAEGATEIINDDVDGYLIKDRNKEEMKNKALELLNNKKKLATFGHEARIKSMNYSYENTKEKWLGIIEDILGE